RGVVERQAVEAGDDLEGAPAPGARVVGLLYPQACERGFFAGQQERGRRRPGRMRQLGGVLAGGDFLPGDDVLGQEPERAVVEVALRGDVEAAAVRGRSAVARAVAEERLPPRRAERR